MSLILGIETSCDETAVGVVREGRAVAGHCVAAQHGLHERYRGVVPEIASRAHLEWIGPTVQGALDEAGVGFDELDAIAVGNRPGLIGSLIVGVSAAQALAWGLGLPLVGIDHVQAHLYAPFLVDEQSGEAGGDVDGAFPALGLVVSGGHTSLYWMQDPTRLERVGRTIDDAVGEAYDKAAVILGLGYPGGPAIDELAGRGDARACALPRSLLGRESLDFSFSGLKTALLYTVRGRPVGRGAKAKFAHDARELSEQRRADLAASFQQAVVDVVRAKLGRAVARMRDQGREVRSVIVGGGVSANTLLRREVRALAEESGLGVYLPAMRYCVDNGAMIAGLAHGYYERGEFAELDLPAVARAAC